MNKLLKKIHDEKEFKSLKLTINGYPDGDFYIGSMSGQKRSEFLVVVLVADLCNMDKKVHGT